MQNHRIDIIESFDDWKRLAADWNELLKKSASNTVFLTWEWLFSWAECYWNQSRKLFILCVYKDAELVGIAPWHIKHTRYALFSMRQIEFLGAPEGGSDYLDVIAKRGREREVSACLYRFLFERGRSLWDALLLRDIPSPSLFFLHFLDKIESDGKYAEIRHGAYCPFVALPAQRRSFLSSLSSNRREQFRRHLRLLRSQAAIDHRSLSPDDCGSALGDFFALYRNTSRYYRESLCRFIARFASQSAGKNRIQIDFLNADGKNVAGLLHLRYESELGMFLMAVDKAFNPKISIGSVLVGLAIERAFDLGIERYDFLKGHESYKFHWADCGCRSLSVSLSQARLSPLMVSTERFIKYTAKILLR